MLTLVNNIYKEVNKAKVHDGEATTQMKKDLPINFLKSFFFCIF